MPKKTLNKTLAKRRTEHILVKTSGYYEPLKNQKEPYLNGSYKKEKSINYPCGIAAFSGKPPKSGRTIAVDPQHIKPGTVLAIPGWGVVIAQDSGGDIKGNRIDLFCGKGSKALRLAKKWNGKIVKATVLGTADVKKS